MKTTFKEYQKFLKEECYNQTLYYNYKKKIFKTVKSFDESILQKYHKACVTLVDTYGDFAGSNVRIFIKSLLDSSKTAEEKYTEYIKYIDEQIELYNRAYSSRPNKQIRI
jgi:hypothetical protein